MGALDSYIGAEEEAARARQDDAARRGEMASEKHEAVDGLIEDFLNRMETAGNPGLRGLRPNPHAARAWLFPEREYLVTPTGELLVNESSVPDRLGYVSSYPTVFPWSDVARVEALDVDALGAALARKLVEHNTHQLVPGPGIRRAQWKARARREFLGLIPRVGYYGALTAPVITREGAGPMLRHWLVGTFAAERPGQAGGYWTASAYFCEDGTLRTTATHTYQPLFRGYKHIKGLGPPRGNLVPADVVNESLLRIAEDTGLDLGLMPMKRRLTSSRA